MLISSQTEGFSAPFISSSSSLLRSSYIFLPRKSCLKKHAQASTKDLKDGMGTLLRTSCTMHVSINKTTSLQSKFTGQKSKEYILVHLLVTLLICVSSTVFKFQRPQSVFVNWCLLDPGYGLNPERKRRIKESKIKRNLSLSM